MYEHFNMQPGKKDGTNNSYQTRLGEQEKTRCCERSQASKFCFSVEDLFKQRKYFINNIVQLN